MALVRIETGGRAPAEVEEYMRKPVRAVSKSQETDFSDPVMQEAFTEQQDLFERILDALAEDIGALK